MLSRAATVAALNGQWGEVLAWCADNAAEARAGRDTLGYTLLHYACGARNCTCNLPAVRALVALGSDVNALAPFYYHGTAINAHIPLVIAGQSR